MEKLGLLYFGRLDEEKGFDAVVDVVRRFGGEGDELPFQLFVFGDGRYRADIEELAEKFTDVHYFGFQPLRQIYRYVPNCHYCLMPSRFLETFGLSAVNALGWGLPVVGYKKGGLSPFVFDDLDLAQFGGDDVVGDLQVFLEKELKKQQRVEKKNRLSKVSLDIANIYHQVDWEKKLMNFVAGKKRILMVTDFSNKIGGIETYVYDATRAMRGMKHRVEILGAWCPRGALGKAWRYFGMFLSVFNVLFAMRLLIKIWRFKPDVIWFHSTIRWVGWLAYFVIKVKSEKGKMKRKESSNIASSSPEIWMMFHDFGYFYPFPHKLVDVGQIYFPLERKGFMRASKSKLWKRFFVWGKYLQVSLLKYFAKKTVDSFFVPSEYMCDVVAKSRAVDKKKIKVLEHFIQE